MLLGVISKWKLLVCFIMLLGVMSEWKLLVCFIMLFRRIKIFEQKLVCFCYAKYLYKKNKLIVPIASFTILLIFSLFQKCLNLQVRTNKLVSSVFYHPCRSRLASGIHHYFFKLLGVLSFSRMLVQFSNLCIPPCVGKIFQWCLH